VEGRKATAAVEAVECRILIVGRTRLLIDILRRECQIARWKDELKSNKRRVVTDLL
jgi:hypothetical protein